MEILNSLRAVWGRGRRSATWRGLDVWNGETVEIRGRRYFRLPDGKLQPVIAGGGAQGWEELIDVMTADGTAVANLATEASVCPDFNIPAYYMAPGRVLRISAFGVVGNQAAASQTLTLKVKWSVAAQPSGTVLLASSAQGLDSSAHTNALWSLEALVCCRSAGATGTVMSGGEISVYNLLTTTAANLLPALLGSTGTPGSSGNAAVTVNTTVANLLAVTATFGAANAANTITCQQRLVEVLN